MGIDYVLSWLKSRKEHYVLCVDKAESDWCDFYEEVEGEVEHEQTN